MKKLFEIDNSEKQRILEMHQNATKKLYLNEQGNPESMRSNPNQYSVKIKGAKEHDEASLKKSEQLGNEKFGKDKFQVLTTPSGYVVAKNEVAKIMDEEYKEIYGGGVVENSDGLMLLKTPNGKIRVGYLKKEPNGSTSQQYVSGANPLFDRMRKHLIMTRRNANTLAAANSASRKAITDFYNNPNDQTFSELCLILKPTSVFKKEGFPSLTTRCKLDIDYSKWLDINPNDYIRVES